MADIQYANAYTEVLDILKYISKEDYEKIPKSKIKVFEENSNKNYSFKYDVDKTLEEQNVSEIAKMIIAILCRDYWTTNEQRYIIIKKQREVREEQERQIRERIEQNRQIKEDSLKVIDVSSDLDLDLDYSRGTNLEIYKEENIFKRIISKIKEIFGFQEEELEEYIKREVTTENLMNQVYNKYTEVEEMNIVEKTIEEQEKEDKIQEIENELEI